MDQSHNYRLKHVRVAFDQRGVVYGMAIFHDAVQPSDDGNRFSGNEDMFLYDLNGN